MHAKLKYSSIDSEIYLKNRTEQWPEREMGRNMIQQVQ